MELKKYDITTDNGYQTTILLSDEDAKVRGLTGKDTETLAQLEAEAAEAAAAEKAATEKQTADTQNKQAKPAGNK